MQTGAEWRNFLAVQVNNFYLWRIHEIKVFDISLQMKIPEKFLAINVHYPMISRLTLTDNKEMKNEEEEMRRI